jgi:hypothetical protein
MGINYAAALKHANFWKTDVIPYLRHIAPPMSFSDYLTGFYHNKSSTKTYGMPLSYLWGLDFLKKHQTKCVSFQYNNPEEVKNGASIMSSIHQFSEKLHGMVNISLWHDESEDKSNGHCTVFLIYEDLEDVMTFIEDNMDVVKREEDNKKVGFASGPPEGF